MTYIIIDSNSTVVYTSNTKPIVSGKCITVNGYKFIQPNLEILEVESLPEDFQCHRYGYNKETEEFFKKDVPLNPPTDIEYSLNIRDGVGEESVEYGHADTKAYGKYSLAGGYPKVYSDRTINTEAHGIASANIGKGNITYGHYSATFGCEATTGLSDDELTSMGDYALHPDYKDREDLTRDEKLFNWGQNTLAVGWRNRAIGESSAALSGSGNTAKGKCSITLGGSNETYSYSTVALGYLNKVGDPNDPYFGHYKGESIDGHSAIGIGNKNTIKHKSSIGIGEGLISGKASQILLGKYNKSDSGNLVVIGNGTSSSRKNVVTISKDGNVDLSEGKVHVGIDPTAKLNNVLTLTNTNTLRGFHDNTDYTSKKVLKEEPGLMHIDPTGEIRRHTSVHYGRNIIVPIINGKMSSVDYNQVVYVSVTVTIGGVEKRVENLNGRVSEVWDSAVSGTAVNQIRLIFDETAKCVDGSLINTIDLATALTGKIVSDTDIKLCVKCENNTTTGIHQPKPVHNQTVIGTSAIPDNDALFIIGNGHGKAATGTITNEDGSTSTIKYAEMLSTAFSVKTNGDTVVGGDLILTSPNGTKFHIGINDDGTLTINDDHTNISDVTLINGGDADE